MVLVPDKEPRLWETHAGMDSSSQCHCLLPSTSIQQSGFWSSLRGSRLEFWKMKHCWVNKGNREWVWPYTRASLGQTQLPPSPRMENTCLYKIPYVNVHSTISWVNKLWYIYIMEYYSTIKMNEVRTHGTTWMDFKNIMVSEKSQRQQTHTLYGLIYITCPEQRQIN